MKEIRKQSGKGELRNLYKLFFIIFFINLCLSPLYSQYNEQYRPQYHFSPKSGWIGDPDGLIKYNNKYHLFWWGHAESNDLVFWQEMPYPMIGGDGSFDYYSGSVIVDSRNTGGFQTNSLYPPMVAIYTMNNNKTGDQTQGISASNDYTYFQYYKSNPVLANGSQNFRDPSVFWDATNLQWVMAIALPIDKKIQFYKSSNLKQWQLLSYFGLIGGMGQVWEDPDLVQLNVDNDPNNKKWVLICSMGPNKVQYFLGNWNGDSFSMDTTDYAYLATGIGMNGVIFDDFEQGYSKWTVQGTAFGSSPASGTLPNQNTVNGYLGSKLVNSYLNGDASTGTLTSDKFTIKQNCINFLIAGGNHPQQTCINLLINGSIVQTATGDNTEDLKWAGWDVTKWKGKVAQIQIVDNFTGSWGHIDIDQIIFSNVLWNFHAEQAHWVDFGSDFYAVRTFRNYDNDQNRTVWMGWMGNWNYANSTPTTWGRGEESIPREIGLKTFPEGLRIVQNPISELRKLRIDSVFINTKTIENVQNLTEFTPKRNCYELNATFDVPNDSLNFGLNLCVGGNDKVVLGYNAATSNLYLDRRNSGNVSFSSSFPNIVSAPLVPDNGQVKLHVFIDQSSIEVFANDGTQVLTSLIFPDSTSLGIQLFSNNKKTTLQSMKAYNLKSIWNQPSTGVKNTTIEPIHIRLYPNPVNTNHNLMIDIGNQDIGENNVVIHIINTQGEIISEKQYSSSEGHVFVYPNHLTPGIYFVNIQTAIFTKTMKLIVQ